MAYELSTTRKHDNSKAGNAVKPKEIFSNLSYKIKLLSLDFAPKNAHKLRLFEVFRLKAPATQLFSVILHEK